MGLHIGLDNWAEALELLDGVEGTQKQREKDRLSSAEVAGVAPEAFTFSRWSPRRLHAAVTAVVFPLPGGPRRSAQLVPVSNVPLQLENRYCLHLSAQ